MILLTLAAAAQMATMPTFDMKQEHYHEMNRFQQYIYEAEYIATYQSAKRGNKHALKYTQEANITIKK